MDDLICTQSIVSNTLEGIQQFNIIVPLNVFKSYKIIPVFIWALIFLKTKQ